MKFTTFTFIFTLFLMVGCSKSTTIPNDHGAISALKNKPFFEDNEPLIPYNSSTPDLVQMQKCAYANTAVKSCKLSELSLIGLSKKEIAVQDILDRTLLSHQFLGETFKKVLLKMNPEMLKMFGAVSEVIISDKINPSFYLSTSGAIYLSGRYFWRNAEEKKILTQVKDPRDGAGLPFQFSFDYDYIKNGKSIDHRAHKNEQTYEEMSLTVTRLLFHELTHANDFFPAKLYNSSDLEHSKTYQQIAYERFKQGMLESDNQPTMLTSLKLDHIGQVLYQGVEATDEDSKILTEDVITEFKNDLANDSYSYSTTREDFAMNAEETLMLYYYDIPRYIFILKLPSAYFKAPKGYEYEIAWGVKSRIVDPLLIDRGINAALTDLGQETALKIRTKLDKYSAIELPANTKWEEIYPK